MSDDADEKPKDLPYGVEYAKSNRAKCRGCKEPIPKDSLRMAVRFQSTMFDGMQENWHHFDCFWKKARKNDINEASIKGMEWVKWEDQELIRQRMAELQTMPDNYGTPKSAIPKVDCAKTGAGKCFKCKEKIKKGALRISYKASYYDIKCFKELNVLTAGGNSISGYESLDDGKKSMLEEVLPNVNETSKRKADDSENIENDLDVAGPSKAKKLRGGKTVFGEDEKNRKKLKKQSEILWTARDTFSKELRKEEIEEILLANGFFKYKSEGLDKRLEALADFAVFGVPTPCPECEKGVLRFSSSIHSYQCSGFISDFTRCSYTNKNPKRLSLRIPKKLKKEYSILKKYETPLLSKRVYAAVAENDKVIAEPVAFQSLNFVTKKEKPKNENKSIRVTVKNGCSVDGDCEVASVTHVYIEPISKEPWQATLGATDIQSGRNSFYKLQLIKHDDKNEFYLFRSWGRIGVSSTTKLENFGPELTEAKDKFEELFLEKTRNTWGNRRCFQKHKFGMNLMDMDLLNDNKEIKEKIDITKSKSLLPDAIKRLIALIFDVSAMNDTMKELDINLDEMPLGKLSRIHILSAYRILTDVQNHLERNNNNPQNAHVLCLDASNRFYTFIPHNTGLNAPPILNNLNIIKEKATLLDNLLKIQLSYSLIKKEQNDNGPWKDFLDQHYATLNCDIEVLERNSDEFKLIEKYTQNTHASTHSTYRLEIVDVFKLNRESDNKRFRDDIGNRHLLWHGSRTSNYVGILSQGLRIAPPEAPVSGYMFGKGIYMADMVSKSANYCNVHTSDGLLVLCDVALGKMEELYAAKDVRKLSPGKHSVQGIGSTMPNPNETVITEEGLKVPCGKPMKTVSKKKLTLLYNEYIVYDEAQVRMKYLIRVNFIPQIDF